MDLYVKGKDPGNLRLNIPEEHHNLIEVCKQSEGKQARISTDDERNNPAEFAVH
jgi:hypothetical protein